ncbi:Alpha-mann_mid [Nesidiocoris tenuis]|uniref:Alpha-mannosidase n=1 Tax=Nesidiocoris tenuis TaxID=355587 RepID=A0ABN7B712_9HEMI|nr:Alpha-mann_mid [Nesidiocoris tenuis]
MPICLRWGSGRLVASLALGGALLLFVYSWTSTTPLQIGRLNSFDDEEPFGRQDVVGNDVRQQHDAWAAMMPADPPPQPRRVSAECLTASSTDIDTVPRLASFDFQPYWMKSREYWDNNFEKRYKDRRMLWPKLPLKVIVVPHSHNDPGWLKTFESYYHYQTRNILNNMADKLTIFKNMTFIWSEIAFLAQWWQSAHPTKRRLVQKLLDEGRLEITTGGWVMTDEATSHVFGIVNQLIEGHQWVKNKLGVMPQSGWSIDPFGHGPTVPYLLKASGMEGGAVIQRIHYAWKQWLAKERAGDFLWRQGWDPDGDGDMLVHNNPFDIYSIKHSCGPHPQVCLNFDFRKISGEYTEYSLRAVAIDEDNVRAKAELLLEQYGRTGSLFPHNVVLMPVGDDFRFDHDIEWDQQYRNYKRLFDFINRNKAYNAEVNFGTVSDYFKEVRRRMQDFKTLKGDFFVYSDIFSEGRPAYWSGYFTTRPYWKILDRELEAELRSAEILYAMALNRVRRMGFNSTLKILERDFEKLQTARQALALFQHHDAITGTSKAVVMHDYALKMFDGLTEAVAVQSYSLQTLLTRTEALEQLPLSTRFILPDTDRESYENLPSKVPLSIKADRPRRIILFNSLGQYQQEVVRILVRNPNVKVLDADFNPVPSQVNPVWNMSHFKYQAYDAADPPNLRMLDTLFELVFLADLPPLAVTTFSIEAGRGGVRASVFCKDCARNDHFPAKPIQQGDIQIENENFRITIDGRLGFLKSKMDKKTGKVTQCGLQFGAYPSAQFHSGAYLFMPDPNAREAEKDLQDEHATPRIAIVLGPVTSSLSVVYGDFILHTIEIYHTTGALGNAIYIENTVDFGAPPKNRETELFMRFKTDVNNGEPPEFYTDQNGLGTQRRVKIERIGIEGNYYPITTHTYIQDTDKRITILVNHATGGASWQPGWLEVMMDRRTLYDDSRGMGEGVVDNKRTVHKYLLLVEEVNEDEGYSSPSLLAHHLSLGLNYPANVFVLESTSDEATSRSAERNLYSQVRLMSRELPCDVHLMNFRIMQDRNLDHFPSSSALMVLQKMGFSCSTTNSLARCSVSDPNKAFHPGTRLLGAKVNVTSVTLTGLKVLRHLGTLAEADVKPMHLTSLNVTFL